MMNYKYLPSSRIHHRSLSALATQLPQRPDLLNFHRSRIATRSAIHGRNISPSSLSLFATWRYATSIWNIECKIFRPALITIVDSMDCCKAALLADFLHLKHRLKREEGGAKRREKTFISSNAFQTLIQPISRVKSTFEMPVTASKTSRKKRAARTGT